MSNFLNKIKQKAEETKDLAMGASRTYVPEGVHLCTVATYELVDRKNPKTGKPTFGPAFGFEVIESDATGVPPKQVLSRLCNLNVDGYSFKYRCAEIMDLIAAVAATSDMSTVFQSFPELAKAFEAIGEEDDPAQQVKHLGPCLELADKMSTFLCGAKVRVIGKASGQVDKDGKPYINVNYLAVE